MDWKVIVDLSSVIAGMGTAITLIASIFFWKKDRDDSKEQFKNSIEQSKKNIEIAEKNLDESKRQFEKNYLLTQKIELMSERIKNEAIIRQYFDHIIIALTELSQYDTFETSKLDVLAKLDIIYSFFLNFFGSDIIIDCYKNAPLDVKENKTDEINLYKKYFSSIDNIQRISEHYNCIQEEMQKFKFLFCDFDSSGYLMRLVDIHSKFRSLEKKFIEFHKGIHNVDINEMVINLFNLKLDYFKLIQPSNPQDSPYGEYIKKILNNIQKVAD